MKRSVKKIKKLLKLPLLVDEIQHGDLIIFTGNYYRENLTSGKSYQVRGIVPGCESIPLSFHIQDDKKEWRMYPFFIFNCIE